MTNHEHGNELCQSSLHDESGDTASSTNGSDPETILTCNDEPKQTTQPVSKKLFDCHESKVARGQALEIDTRESIKTVDYSSGKPVDSFFHRTRPNLARVKSDDTSPLSEEQAAEEHHYHRTDGSNAREIKSLSSHEMRNELDQIESKIKAAINHNSQVHYNSLELETVLRKSLSGRVLIPMEVGAISTQLDSLGAPDLDLEGVLPVDSVADEISNQSSSSVFDAQQENRMLKQQLAEIKAEFSRVTERSTQEERLHRSTVAKLKKDLRDSKKLIHKLQTDKLQDMEKKFTVSLDLLEAKLSEDINCADVMEQKLAAMREERDTARELNLPLFNDLKKLYEIKSRLEDRVEELTHAQEEQAEINKGLQKKVDELLTSKKELLEKERI